MKNSNARRKRNKTMAIYVVIKTISERSSHGEDCNEVVGLYAGALKVDSTQTFDSQAERWIIEYLEHLDPGSNKFAFKRRSCSDSNVKACFDLLEEGYYGGLVPFETVYFYPLKAHL